MFVSYKTVAIKCKIWLPRSANHSPTASKYEGVAGKMIEIPWVPTILDLLMIDVVFSAFGTGRVCIFIGVFGWGGNLLFEKT